MVESVPVRIACYVGGAYLLLNLYALLDSDRQLFQPQIPSYTMLPNEVKIPSGNNQLVNAVFLEHPNAAHTILFSHGNAEDLGNVVPFMQRYHELGYSVLMYDYRGYGTSEGKPSTRNAKEDVAAAYRWLINEKKIDPHTIIAHGRSIGGGPATWLAANHPVGGLVLESTFVSAFRVRTIVPFLPWDKFNNLHSIKKVDCPVLVIHGRDDEVLPFWHGKKLYEAAPGKKMNLWIDEGMHNDYAYVAGDAYFGAFQRFVETHLK